MSQSARNRPGTRALVIGAGVAGIVAAIELRDAGFDVLVVEKASRLGGTWRENTYPGVACDVPSHLYSFSFEPNPYWSHTFAPGAEIQAYLESVAERRGILDLIRFDTPIATLQHVPGGWTARTADGEQLEADVVIAATGVLHHPNDPDIDGLDTFTGPRFHSARWDHDVDVTGARVGIIGAGSTAVQVTTAIAEHVDELHLFQRTPQWVLPMPNDPISGDERRQLAGAPGAIAERRRGPSGTTAVLRHPDLTDFDIA